MTILAFPTDILGPTGMQLSLRGNTQSGGRSPFDGTEQTLELPGAAWVATLTFRLSSSEQPPHGGQAQVLEAFLASLRGRAGRFTWAPPRRRRGVAQTISGGQAARQISGAGQSGSAIVTAGWPANTANLYLPGDSIGWLDPTGRAQMHLVTAAAGSTSAGVCTVAISPPIRRSPGSATPLLAAPSPVWRLAQDAQRIGHQTNGMVEFSLDIEEANF
jgi:hypothetical protein